MATGQRLRVREEMKMTIGIIAVDTTIDRRYPRTVLFLFDDCERAAQYLRMIRDNGNYSDIRLMEFDRILKLK